MARELVKKQMFCVEKFLPPECPKCRHPFNKEVSYAIVETPEGYLKTGEKIDGDYTRLLGDIVDGQKVVRETRGYNIIICTHCKNHTARYPLESFQFFTREQAEKLVAEKGFVNLVTVEAVGNMAREFHTIIAKSPGIVVGDAMKDAMPS
jgi:hypothetical protein